MHFKLLLKVHHDNHDLNEEELKILLPLIDRLIKLKKINIILMLSQHRLTTENNQFVFDKEAKEILTVACEKQHRELIKFIFKNYQKADAVENIPVYIQLLINFAKNNSSESYKLLSSLIPLPQLELATLPLITLLSKHSLDDKKNLDDKAIRFLLQHGCRVNSTSFMKLISRNIDTVAEELILLFLDHIIDLTVLQATFDKYLLTAFKLKWFDMPQQIPSIDDFIKIIEVNAHHRNPAFAKVIKKFIKKGCHVHEFLNSYRSIALAKKIILASSIDAILNPDVESSITTESKITTKQSVDSTDEYLQKLYQEDIDRLCERDSFHSTAENNRKMVNLTIEDLLKAAEDGDYQLINEFISNDYVMDGMFRAKRGKKYKFFYDHFVQKTISHNFFTKAFENNFNELKHNFEMYAFNLERAVTKLEDKKSFETIIEGMLDSAFNAMKFATREELIQKVKHFKGAIFSDDSEMLHFYLRLILYPQLQEAIKSNDLQQLQHLLRNYKDILILETKESKQLSDNPSQNRLHESVNLYSLVVNVALPDDILYSSSLLGLFSARRNTDRDNAELLSIRSKFLKHAFILDRLIKAYSANIDPEIVYTLISNFPGIEELVLRFLVTQPDSSVILKYLIEHGIQATEKCISLALDKGHYTYAVILAGTSVQLQKKLGKLSNAQQMADAWGLPVQEYMDYQFKAEQETPYGASEKVANEILPILETAKYIEQNYGITDEDKKTAMNLAILFGSLENALKYLENYSEAYSDNPQPIHDACLFQVPHKGLWQIPIWRKLIFKYGDALIRYVRLAPVIETILYGDEIPLSLLRDSFEKQYQKDFYEKLKLHFAKVYDAGLTQEKLSKIMNEHRKIAVARVAAKFKDNQLSNIELQQLIQEEMELLQKKLQDEKEGYIQQQTENQIKLMIAKELENILLARLQKICLFVTRNDTRLELQRIDLLNLSLPAIQQLIAKISFKRGEESPELAIKCITAGLDERSFEYALELKKTFKTQDYLPDLFIDGDDGNDIGEPNYYMVKLPVDDDRGLMLGVDTHSCQALGMQGSSVAIQGKTSLYSTFYVIMKKPLGNTDINKYKDEIFGQCYAWISIEGNICFCSLEARRPQLAIKFVKFYNSAAKKLICQKVTLPSSEIDAEGNPKLITKEIQRVTVGQGGGTPKEMGWPVATNPEVPLPGEVAHPDSKAQWILADKIIDAELESKSHKSLRPPLGQ